MIRDDDLLLYHYRELDGAERARISAALGEQPELARRLHALVARLDALAAPPEVPVPEHTQRRWQAALERAATATPALPATRPALLQQRWQLAAAAAVGVALLLGIQQLMAPVQLPENDLAAAPGFAGAEVSAYEQGLKFHLASTERRLANLGEASPEDRARLIETIIGQNRVYALAAERAGEPQLARVLRAFTPVLENLAKDDSEATASGIAQLGFELRVMQARLGPGAKPSNTL